MTDWDKVREIFVAAADLPAVERNPFLDAVCAGERELRAEVESLLDEDLPSEDDLAGLVANEASDFLEMETLIGERLGDYRVTREIGRGGMGSVFLAVRDDQQFHKQAAIKVVRRGMDSADVLARFRRERQILANLDHPYIARLLDGGTTPDGRPFFVLEYVAGEPLDRYLATHSPDIRERCALFLKICEGVSYAHQKLVAHLDLKPANIYITPQGTPKLLDFGVAKLLSTEGPDSSPHTASARPVTPEYASPEQIHGLPAGAATDIYALGAILYEMLSGRRAHQFKARSAREIERVVCELDPPRLGEIHPRLTGPWRDLEAVIAKAMRKEQSLRYASVEQLASDLERCWRGLPVLARQGSLSYRARKFLQRHGPAVAVTTMLAATLVAGTAVSLRQARRASFEQRLAEQESRTARENQQRAEANRREAETQALNAERERELADRRFGQVRELAGKFLIDFHDAIADLPGSTQARKMVMETGLRYFDMLMAEANGDRDLLEEIARGYDRLGNVQGNFVLGESDSALDSYRKAQSIRDRIQDPSPVFQSEALWGRVHIAQLLIGRGDVTQAGEMLQSVIATAQQPAFARSRAVREVLAEAYWTQGNLLGRLGQLTESGAPMTRSLEIYSELAQANPASVTYALGVGSAHEQLADLEIWRSNNRSALSHAREAVRIFERLLAQDPNNQRLRSKLLTSCFALGGVFNNDPQLARPEEDKSVVERAAALASEMALANPNDRTTLEAVARAMAMLGDWQQNRNRDPAEAIGPYRKAVEAAEKFASDNPVGLSSVSRLAFVYQRLASAYARTGQYQQALEQTSKAEAVLDRAEKHNLDNAHLKFRRGGVLEVQAMVYQQQEMWDQAIANYTAATRMFIFCNTTGLREPPCMNSPSPPAAWLTVWPRPGNPMERSARCRQPWRA